jgi:tRNA nucleotidyltransferase/poly(A) polymerase
MKSIAIPKRYKSIIDKISITAEENNFDAYIVGGFVRDLFIEREPTDLDVVVCSRENDTPENLVGINFSKILAYKYNLSKPAIFERFGTSKLIIDGEETEFVMPRKERYSTSSRNPIIQTATLKQDALRRDFTINTLLLRLKDMKVLDFTSKGIKDIKNRVIRAADPSKVKVIFSQDPLRILRAIRQSLQLGFSIELETYTEIKTSASRIKIVSPERIQDEINKILVEKFPSKALNIMKDTNLLAEIIPEVLILKNQRQFLRDFFYHNNTATPFIQAMKIIDKTKNNIELRMAVLLHSIIDNEKFGNPKNNKDFFYEHNYKNTEEIEAILKRLKYSQNFIKKTLSIVQNYTCFKMHPRKWVDSEVRKFVKMCGKEFDLIMDFLEADCCKESTNTNLIKFKKVEKS